MRREIYIDTTKLPQHLVISQKEANLIIQRKIRAIKKHFRKYGYKKAVIGLSGGIDSTLAAALTVRALGGRNLIVVRMPYEKLFQDSLRQAEKIALSLGVPRKNILTVPVTRAVDASWKKLKNFPGGDKKIRKGNMMARERMKILFDLSSAIKAVVVGTENKTECYLGYYTVGGDHVSGFEPILDLWKTQVYQLAGFMKEMPDFVLKKVPTAGLWKGQSDEGELGVSYADIDIILSAFIDFGMSQVEIKKKFKIPQTKVNSVLTKFQAIEGKRQMPYILNGRREDKQAINTLVKNLIRILKKKKLWLGIMESCTGGGLTNSITNIPHASEILKGARIVYSNEEKIKHGIAKSLIKKYSVYSPEVALALARQARKKISSAKIGIGVTGQFDGVGRVYPHTKTFGVGVYAAVVFGKKSLVKELHLPALKKRWLAKDMVIRKVLEMINAILIYK